MNSVEATFEASPAFIYLSQLLFFSLRLMGKEGNTWLYQFA